MAKLQTLNLSYKISMESLSKLMDKIDDLTSLDSTITFKFGKTDLLIYAEVGIDKNISAFKSHNLKIKDFFSKPKNEVEEDVILRLSDGKIFYTSITEFLKILKIKNNIEELDFVITFQDDYKGEKITIKHKSGGKEEHISKIITQKETSQINLRTQTQINQVMNTDNVEFSFDLLKEDYDYIKKKSSKIEKENDMIYLNIVEKSLSLGENRWDWKICEIEYEDTNISFPKKYFKCINYDGEKSMKIYVTERYLIILGDSTNLMIATELTA